MRRAAQLLFASLSLILIVSGCGDSDSGGSGNASNSGNVTIPADFNLPTPDSTDYDEAKAAVRFLIQSSFGPTVDSIETLMGAEYEAWIDSQIALPQTRHLPLLEQRLEEIGFTPIPEEKDPEEAWIRDLQRSDIWWESAVWGEDQLRQRVAYALSQILVISNVSDALFNVSRGIANYHDILAEHSFGNYRDLLEAVTLNPMMGQYLSMLRNEKADPTRNIRPDENYAREIMQLFSIGLVELNLDGSIKLDTQDQPIPTYDQDDIKELARVFTGWNHATNIYWWQWANGGNYEVLPMKAFPQYHDNGTKTLFDDQIIPADQTPAADIDSALDILFAHVNVAPFISKQLIQRLVSSNPSPSYVQRVATVFNNNGFGVKGDMRAVIKAILLDEEARDGHTANPTTFGKLKEPLLKVSALWRAFNVQGIRVREENGSISQNRLRYRGTDRSYGQRPYGSFSVFNFYRPDYQPPGIIKDAGLLAPEFQIHTESKMIASTNELGNTIYYRDAQSPSAQTEEAQASWDMYPARLDLTEEKAIADTPQALLDRINLLLMAGYMSQAMHDEILAYMNTQATDTDWARELMIYDALYLVCSSPEFSVQR